MSIKLYDIGKLMASVTFVYYIVWFILPSFSTNVINHNIKKDIDANVYIYSEIKIKKEWAK